MHQPTINTRDTIAQLAHSVCGEDLLVLCVRSVRARSLRLTTRAALSHRIIISITATTLLLDQQQRDRSMDRSSKRQTTVIGASSEHGRGANATRAPMHPHYHTGISASRPVTQTLKRGRHSLGWRHRSHAAALRRVAAATDHCRTAWQHSHRAPSRLPVDSRALSLSQRDRGGGGAKVTEWPSSPARCSSLTKRSDAGAGTSRGARRSGAPADASGPRARSDRCGDADAAPADANGRCPAHTRVPASFSNERTPGSCAIVIQAGSTSSAASSMQGQQRESGLSSVSLSLSCTYQELSANDFIGVLGLGRLFSLLVRSPVLIITEVIPAPPAIVVSAYPRQPHTRVHTSTFAQQSRNTPTPPAPPQVASIRGCPREQ